MINSINWKTLLVTLVILFGLFFLLPNFFLKSQIKNWPSWLPNKQISLGLDLEGGSHLLLEIEIESVLKERLEGLVGDIRNTLRSADPKISYSGLGLNNQQVFVRIRKSEDFDRAKLLISKLSQPLSASSGLMGSSQTDLEIDFDERSGEVSIVLTEEAIDSKRKTAVDQSIEIIRRRIDETGTREPSIQRQGSNRVLVQLPGVDDPDRIKRLLGKTARLTFQLAASDIDPQGRIPAGLAVYTSDDNGKGLQREIVLQKRVMLSGENLLDAQPSFDQQSGGPAVSFRLDASGGRKFGQVTKNNIGRQFAIVLDGKVISAPVIRSAILGGNGIITGGFSVEEANDLAVLLRAGALPAPLSVLEERSVGPGLGADSVYAGKIASLIAFLAVMVFMFLAYGLFGLFANFALIVNLILIGGSLSLLQATLTLPGIAGIVLTIGMAVDANVLIFERIKEEVRSGKTPIASIEAGFSRALTTIIDANVTTLIAAIILFSLGSGPVKGFAVTLALGIASSMFTAIILTRLVVVSWMRGSKPNKILI